MLEQLSKIATSRGECCGMKITKELTSYIIMACSPVAILLHAFGLLLLFKARKSPMDKTQRLIITNLSLTELCINAAFLLEVVLTSFSVVYPFKLNFIILRVLICSFYFSTISLTINRFMRIYLNIKYPLYWSVRRTWYTIILIWLASISLAFMHRFVVKSSIYTDLTLDFVLILFSFSTYGFASIKSFRMGRRNRDNGRHSIEASMAVRRQMFRGFLMSSFIIGSSVILIVIPHIIFSYIKLIDSSIYSPQLHLTLDIFGILAYWSDALIYIFLSHHIRKLACGMFTSEDSSLRRISTFLFNQSRRRSTIEMNINASASDLRGVKGIAIFNVNSITERSTSSSNL